MTEQEFIKAVFAMRKAQQKYSESVPRNVNYLNKARKLEKIVDDYLFPKPPDTQARMF